MTRQPSHLTLWSQLVAACLLSTTTKWHFTSGDTRTLESHSCLAPTATDTVNSIFWRK